MAGVNLSQSVTAQGEESKNSFLSSFSFSSGLPISVVLLVLTLIGWGGLRLYMSSLDGKLSRLDADIAASSAALQNDQVDRIANFDAKLSLLNADPAESVDPAAILSQLEALIVPQVTLTNYAYDQVSGESTISGKTNNFRYVAEQIISLKSSQLFSQVAVTGTSRGEEGVIEFTLIASQPLTTTPAL